MKFALASTIIFASAIALLEARAIAHGDGPAKEDQGSPAKQPTVDSPPSKGAKGSKKDAEAPEKKSESSSGPKPKAQSPKPPQQPNQPQQKVLPKTAMLPAAGEWKAADLFPLAEKLHGMKVEPETPGTSSTRVLITGAMAGKPATREDLAILLSAFRVYLFPFQKKDGRVLVASLDPEWSPEKAAARLPRIYRKFPIRASMFEVIRKKVEDYIAEKNKELPDGAPVSSLAADPRTSVLIVQATSPRTIAGVEEIVHSALQSAPESIRLHSYSPANCRAEELRENLLEALSEEQRRKVSVVVPRAKNILLIRAPEALYEQLEEKLRSLDRKSLNGKSEVGRRKSEVTNDGEKEAPQ
jgi:hypothetical protein